MQGVASVGPVRGGSGESPIYASASNRAKKLKVRQLLNRAVRTGRVTRQPCETCGNTKSEAHHHDYTKPYDVQWLCRLHHRIQKHPELIIVDEFSHENRRDRRKEARRLRDGKCRHCSKPRISARYCEYHLKLRRQQAARWRRKKESHP